MNLMFYNFNDFNKVKENSTAAPNGRRPTAAGQNDGRRPVTRGNTGN